MTNTILFIVFVIVVNGGAALYREWTKRKALAAAQAQRAREGGTPPAGEDARTAERRAARKAQKASRVQAAIRARQSPASQGARATPPAQPPAPPRATPLIPVPAMSPRSETPSSHAELMAAALGRLPSSGASAILAKQGPRPAPKKRSWGAARLREGFIATAVLDRPRGASPWRPVA